MQTRAIIFEQPEKLRVATLDLTAPTDEDVVVDVDYSAISTGTERLLWNGRMPAFPGFGYPLVPGYEAVGTVVEAGSRSGRRVGETVFVPGANCYKEARGLFGAAASRVVANGKRISAVDAGLSDRALLLALAATGYHALASGALPDLIVGHGVLGRLIARLTRVLGGSPTVWETNADRRAGQHPYPVVAPADDDRRDYHTICDVSGDATILDGLVARLAIGGEIILAGFYADRLSFSFAPAFMREARLRIAAEWNPEDLTAVSRFVAEGKLDLNGLITHHAAVDDADRAYRTAFGDSQCLKMVLDWRDSV